MPQEFYCMIWASAPKLALRGGSKSARDGRFPAIDSARMASTPLTFQN
jgi:hypothetical protein